MSVERRRSPEQATDIKPPIDWAAIRKRLDDAQSSIDRGWVPGPEEQKEILKRRARALAAEARREIAGEKIEIVEFLLAQERYGIDVTHVQEVYHLSDLAPVPCTPAYILGIINVRGRIVPVIDLKKFFELPEKGLGDLDSVIILKSEMMEFGVLADSIISVRKIPVNELQKALPTLSGIREQYLKGIAADRTIVLDAPKLLADRNLVVNEQV